MTPLTCCFAHFLFRSLSSVCLFTACVLCYCCVWSHSRTHTHSIGFPCTRYRSVVEGCTCKALNIHKRQTSVPPAGFEFAIPTSERPQTQAVDRAALCT